MEDNFPIISGRVYGLARTGRLFPNRNFTSSAIIRQRFTENTTPLAISAGLLLPALMQVNRQLDEYAMNGMELSITTTLEMLWESVKENLSSFISRLSRVAVQTLVCCALLRIDNPYGSSVVFLWDSYPRLHQHYASEIVSLLKLPPFLSTLAGWKPTQMDLKVHMVPIPALAALEDSAKRNTVLLVADVVVDTVEFFIQRRTSRRRKPFSELATRAIHHVSLVVCKVSGAAAGRQVAGARGEYWGEIFGTCVASLVAAQVTLLFFSPNRHRVTSGGGGDSGGRVEDRLRSRSKEGREGREGRSRVSTHRMTLDKTA